jgi:hypothetical protein
VRGRSLAENPVHIRINVKGGTLADKFLCESCQYATIMRGPSMKETAVRCSATEGPAFTVPFRVVQCNGYRETDSTDLRRMKDQAYYVHSNAYGGVYLLTRGQFDDYDYQNKLAEADARKLSRNGKKQSGFHLSAQTKRRTLTHD